MGQGWGWGVGSAARVGAEAGASRRSRLLEGVRLEDLEAEDVEEADELVEVLVGVDLLVHLGDQQVEELVVDLTVEAGEGARERGSRRCTEGKGAGKGSKGRRVPQGGRGAGARKRVWRHGGC